MNSVRPSLGGTMFLFVDLVTKHRDTVKSRGSVPELVDIPLLNGGHPSSNLGPRLSLPFSPKDFLVNYLLP